MSKNKILLIIIIIVIILAGVFVLYQNSNNSKAQGDLEVNTPVDDSISNSTNQDTINNETTEVAPEEIKPSEIKEFKISGGNFSFSLKEIKVKKGEKVRIVFTNNEGFHDFIIYEFNVNTGQIKAGETKTVEFMADKTGTFEYYCSVGQHRANGMFGKLIVE